MELSPEIWLRLRAVPAAQATAASAQRTLERVLRVLAHYFPSASTAELAACIEGVAGAAAAETPSPKKGEKPPPQHLADAQARTLRAFMPGKLELWVEDMLPVVTLASQISATGIFAHTVPKGAGRRAYSSIPGPRYDSRHAIPHIHRGNTFTRASQRPSASGTRPRDCADLAASWSMARSVSGSWKGSRKTRPWNDTPGPGTYADVLFPPKVTNPRRGEFPRAGGRRTPQTSLPYGVSARPRFPI